MGPEYSEMIQKTENTNINNSLIVGDSFTEKSSNGDNSIFSQDEENLNHSKISSEDVSTSSSEDPVPLDACSRDAIYYVTAGSSPLSVVIKRRINPATLSEDSCSNNFDNLHESPRSSTFENAPKRKTKPCDPDSKNELDKDANPRRCKSQNSSDHLNQSVLTKPCTVVEYVETIKSLVNMGLSVSESDQCEAPLVVIDGEKSLVEILQGSQNTEEKTNHSNDAVSEDNNDCFQKFYRLPCEQEPIEDAPWNTDSTGIDLPVETDSSLNQSSPIKRVEQLSKRIEDVVWNSESTNFGFPAQNENSLGQSSPNERVEELSISSSSLCNGNLSLNASKSSFAVMDRSSLIQSTSSETSHKPEVETRHFIFEDSYSSPKSDNLRSETDNLQFQVPNILRHEPIILKSDCETCDLQLETTNSFDNASLIDVGVDRIVYSPTLFSDEEDTENSSSRVQKISPSDIFRRRSKTTEARRLKQLQISMNGLPPPPSVTNPQLSVSDILRSLKENKAAMAWTCMSPRGKEQQAKLLQDATETVWPEAATSGYPDIYYNNGMRSEQFALLSQKFVQRYVGTETACFCNVGGTTGSARKRNKKLGVGFSPGRRLSHLARRRKAFSRDNLLSGNAGSVPKSQPNALSERRQIVIEAKPKPVPQKPVISKPSLSFKSAVTLGPRVLSHKRALFQSPEEGKKVASAKKSQSGSKRNISLRTGVESFKRALFGSASKDKEVPEVKRLKNDENHLVASSSKRKLLFDNLEGPSKMKGSQLASNFNTNLPGSSSTMKTDAKSALLNSGHKKKLLWAVAESLRKKGITMSHALFRPCASSLARVCRSLLPDLQRHNGSTSELMLEIADKYASDIVREKKAELNTL